MMKKLTQTPGEVGKMRKGTHFLNYKKGNVTKRSSTTTKKGGKKSEEPSTLIQNNRELASALNKARFKIGGLETEKLSLQCERQQLMEQVSCARTELKKCNKDVSKKSENAQYIKEIYLNLKAKLHKAIEKLMESSELLADAVQCTNLLHQMAHPEIDGKPTGNCSCSPDITRTPLKIFCGDSHHTSPEVDPALSITTMTPSSSSSSDNELATSLAMDVLVTPDTLFGHPHNVMMDVDSPVLSPDRDLPISCSTPNVNPARDFGPVVGLLAVTHEDVNNISVGSPPVPSAALSAVKERRTSRRRVVIENVCGYKEPRLNSKLRQGDPYTDCSLFPPRSMRKKSGRFSLKREKKR